MHIEEMKQLYVIAAGAIGLGSVAIILAVAAYFATKQIVLDLLPVIRGCWSVR
jgi:hypothetical protein